MKFGCQQFCSNSHSVEIVVHSKKSLFQQKFPKKLYHFNRNSCDVKMILVLLGIRPHPKTCDSATLVKFVILCCVSPLADEVVNSQI